MTPDPSISDRLAEIAMALRSPLSRDLSGEMTALGDQRADGLTAMLRELPQIKAETPDDALALAVIAGAMLQVVAANAEGNHLAYEATVTLAQAIEGLTACLSGMASRPLEDFNVRTSAPAALMQ